MLGVSRLENSSRNGGGHIQTPAVNIRLTGKDNKAINLKPVIIVAPCPSAIDELSKTRSRPQSPSVSGYTRSLAEVRFLQFRRRHTSLSSAQSTAQVCLHI